MHVRVYYGDRTYAQEPESYRLRVRGNGINVFISVFHEDVQAEDCQLANIFLSNEAAEWLARRLLDIVEVGGPAEAIADVQDDRTIAGLPTLRNRPPGWPAGWG